MLKKLNKIIFILTLFLMYICASSCLLFFRPNSVTFANGEYEYTGEILEFEELNEQIEAYFDILDEKEYNAFSISYVKLTFTKVNKDDYDIMSELYDEEKSTNIIVNRSNENVYHVDFYIEDKDHSGYLCDFIVSDYLNGMLWDNYVLEVDVSKMLNIDDAKLYLNFSCSYESKNKLFSHDLYVIYISNGSIKIDEKFFNWKFLRSEFIIHRKENK